MGFVPGIDQNHIFMKEALKLAQEAEQHAEVPIGAVVVDEGGTIIGRGFNQVESLKTQTAHAEVLAIQEATRYRNDWRLNNCWLYVTLEPCTMCMGLIRLSRMAGIIYGASSPLFGYRLDSDDSFQVYKDDSLQIVSGVMENEAKVLLKRFFQKKRNKGE